MQVYVISLITSSYHLKYYSYFFIGKISLPLKLYSIIGFRNVNILSLKLLNPNQILRF